VRRLTVAAAATVAFVAAGCGGSSSHAPRPTAADRGAPESACATVGPPCSAITPEGAAGALAEGKRVEGAPPPTLTGGEIQLDQFGGELTGAFENVYQSVYCPYWDPFGHVYTRALGETDWSGDFGGRCITRAEAVRNLRYLMDTQYLPAVRRLGVNLSHDQVDALGDLAWNVGPGVICCELASLLREHAWSAAAVYIRRYSYAGGQFLQGLYDRRVREGQLLQVIERPETAGQRRARWRRELAADERTLAGVRGRLRVLARVMRVDGCDRRIQRREKLGGRCRRWRGETTSDRRRGAVEDGLIGKLRKELA
jgi:GH24 family phage-related lysozyme (muramidase)